MIVLHDGTMTPSRFRLLQHLFVAILCYVVVLEGQGVTALLSKRRKRSRKKEIVIHKIKNPSMGIADATINNLHLRVDEPFLSSPQLNNTDNFDNPMEFTFFYYLATWKDETTTVIGKVEVYPHLDDYEFSSKKKLPELKGLYVANILTSTSHRRKGVGTALLKAVELDAAELMEMYRMELSPHGQDEKNNSIENEEIDEGCDIKTIEIRTHTVQVSGTIRLHWRFSNKGNHGLYVCTGIQMEIQHQAHSLLD